MSELVKLTRDGDIAIITIDNPPVNALSPSVPEGILAAVQQMEQDYAVRAAVLIGSGRTFIAGFDIKEFGKITSGERKGIGLVDYLAAIEAGSKPILAPLHATALGGGLETALAAPFPAA